MKARAPDRRLESTEAEWARWRARVGRAALLLATILPLACGESPEPAGPADGVVFGLIAPFSIHRPAIDGAILAVDEINDAGGLELDGRREKVVLRVEDNENRPETSVSKALKLVNIDRAAVLLGMPRSHNAIPVARVAEQHGVPLISTMSTHPETTAGKRFVFRLAFLDSLQGKVLADFAFDDLGARRAAALVDVAGPYSSHLAEVFREAFESRGGEVVAFETFTVDQLEVTEKLRHVGRSGAEILFMPNYTNFVEVHVAEARRLGLTATFLGGDTWTWLDPIEHPAARGAYFCDFWAPDLASDRVQSFIERYRQLFGIPPSASAALYYDAVAMTAEAIRLAGSAEPDAIRAALGDMGPYQGVTGTIDFRGSGDPLRSVFIRRIEEDGEVRLYREIRP